MAKPDSYSSVITNNYKSFTLNFDYLGKPLDQTISVNLGCIISISDGGSLTDLTIAYAAAIKTQHLQSVLPKSLDRLATMTPVMLMVVPMAHTTIYTHL